MKGSITSIRTVSFVLGPLEVDYDGMVAIAIVAYARPGDTEADRLPVFRARWIPKLTRRDGRTFWTIKPCEIDGRRIMIAAEQNGRVITVTFPHAVDSILFTHFIPTVCDVLPGIRTCAPMTTPRPAQKETLMDTVTCHFCGMVDVRLTQIHGETVMEPHFDPDGDSCTDGSGAKPVIEAPEY